MWVILSSKIQAAGGPVAPHRQILFGGVIAYKLFVSIKVTS